MPCPRAPQGVPLEFLHFCRQSLEGNSRKVGAGGRGSRRCPLPRGGWTAAGAFTSRSGTGKGFVPGSTWWLPALCARILPGHSLPSHSASASSLCRGFSENLLSPRLAALDVVASERLRQARWPVGVQSRKNRQPSLPGDRGGGILHPACGRATSVTLIVGRRLARAAMCGALGWKYRGRV